MENYMKNLNSKKARQRIATLYNIIIVEDREMRELLREDWNNRALITSIETLYNKSRSEYQKAIIQLVEVYGIPHIQYDNVIKERAEEEVVENYNYNDYGLDEWDIR